MRILLLFALIGTFGAAVAQKPPPDGSCAWLLSESDTVYTVVEVAWKWTPTNRVQSAFISATVCNNRCLGRKHFLHDQCDLSCDQACAKVHETNIPPFVGVGPSNEELEGAATLFGVANAAELMWSLRQATDQ
jgi:hypothetical protein